MEWLSSLGLFGTIVRGIIVFIEAILVLNLLILVHEWGHFLAARWRGLKVEKFYIWFGKPIWKRVYNGVEYGLGSIPLGGFVQLPQMGPMGGLEGEEEGAEKLQMISPLDKVIVAFAGPLFSFLLAVLFAVLVSWVGMPELHTQTTVIGDVIPDKPGAKAGLKAGDKILEIDGTPVHAWEGPINTVRERIAFSEESLITFKIQRPGVAEPIIIKSGFDVEPATWQTRKGLRKVSVGPDYPLYVEKILPGSPAERAGLQKGDIIKQLNGQPLYTLTPLDEATEKSIGQPMHLAVERKGATIQVDLTPIQPEKPTKIPEGYERVAHLGIGFGAAEPKIVHPGVYEQIVSSATAVKRTFGGLFNSVFRAKGDISIQQMGGPVKIISTYAQLFQQNDGWRRVLWFSVLLNVNLALMNLIPLPVFDGGHIVMAIGGWMRRGSLLPIKVMEMVQTACVLCLLCLFAYLTWFDSWDLAGGKAKKDEPPFKLEDIVYPASK